MKVGSLSRGYDIPLDTAKVVRSNSAEPTFTFKRLSATFRRAYIGTS